jgi:hypothetical protein
MQILLSGLAIFLLTPGILLTIPLTVHFELFWRQDLKGYVTLFWLFGLIRIRIFLPNSKLSSAKNKKWMQGFKRAKSSSAGETHFFTGLRQKAFRRRIIRYLHDCWHAIHKTNVTVHGRVGLGDPADTGQFWAIMGPITAMLENIRSASIHIEPEFIDATLELESHGKIRFVPLQLCYLTIGLFLSPTIWRGVRLKRGLAKSDEQVSYQ